MGENVVDVDLECRRRRPTDRAPPLRTKTSRSYFGRPHQGRFGVAVWHKEHPCGGIAPVRETQHGRWRQRWHSAQQDFSNSLVFVPDWPSAETSRSHFGRHNGASDARRREQTTRRQREGGHNPRRGAVDAARGCAFERRFVISGDRDGRVGRSAQQLGANSCAPEALRRPKSTASDAQECKGYAP